MDDGASWWEIAAAVGTCVAALVALWAARGASRAATAAEGAVEEARASVEVQRRQLELQLQAWADEMERRKQADLVLEIVHTSIHKGGRSWELEVKNVGNVLATRVVLAFASTRRVLFGSFPGVLITSDGQIAEVPSIAPGATWTLPITPAQVDDEMVDVDVGVQFTDETGRRPQETRRLTLSFVQ